MHKINFYKMELGNNDGVSLVELVVATGLFIVIMLAMAGIFQAVIEGQRNAIASQNVQESLRYALEMIAKELRMAQPYTAVCAANAGITPSNNIYNVVTTGNNKGIYFKNRDGLCVSYKANNAKRFVVTRYNPVSSATYSGYLTPSKIDVTTLDITSSGPTNGYGDSAYLAPKITKQAWITVLLVAQMNTGTLLHKDAVTLQTTISARYYAK